MTLEVTDTTLGGRWRDVHGDPRTHAPNDALRAKGPFFARARTAVVAECWRCSRGLLLGWDDNILTQWAGTDNEYAVLSTCPPDSSDFRWERPKIGPWEMPHLFGAKFEGPRIVRN